MQANFVAATIACAVLCSGCLPAKDEYAASSPEMEMSLPNLMKQVRGEAVYWNEEGERWTESERQKYSFLYPDRLARRWAIQDVGKLGSDAREVVPELICLLQEHGDYCPGKGAIPFRSDIARALGAIDDPRGANALIEVLRQRAGCPDDPSAFIDGSKFQCFSRGDLAWHVEKKHLRYPLSNLWGTGIGPEGIVDGLVLFGPEHHQLIRQELVRLSLDLRSTDLLNDWTQLALDEGIAFFDASDSEQNKIREYVIQKGGLRK